MAENVNLEGASVFLKDSNNNIIAPITHAKSVYMGDGSISLEEKFGTKPLFQTYQTSFTLTVGTSSGAGYTGVYLDIPFGYVGVGVSFFPSSPATGILICQSSTTLPISSDYITVLHYSNGFSTVTTSVTVTVSVLCARADLFE